MRWKLNLFLFSKHQSVITSTEKGVHPIMCQLPSSAVCPKAKRPPLCEFLCGVPKESVYLGRELDDPFSSMFVCFPFVEAFVFWFCFIRSKTSSLTYLTVIYTIPFIPKAFICVTAKLKETEKGLGFLFEATVTVVLVAAT